MIEKKENETQMENNDILMQEYTETDYIPTDVITPVINISDISDNKNKKYEQNNQRLTTDENNTINDNIFTNTNTNTDKNDNQQINLICNDNNNNENEIQNVNVSENENDNDNGNGNDENANDNNLVNTQTTTDAFKRIYVTYKDKKLDFSFHKLEWEFAVKKLYILPEFQGFNNAHELGVTKGYAIESIDGILLNNDMTTKDVKKIIKNADLPFTICFKSFDFF